MKCLSLCSMMMAMGVGAGRDGRCGSPLVSQLGLGCPNGVVSAELLLVVTSAGVDMLGIIKHRVKAPPVSSLYSIDTFRVSIFLLKVMS
jgi:hypothetical protein